MKDWRCSFFKYLRWWLYFLSVAGLVTLVRWLVSWCRCCVLFGSIILASSAKSNAVIAVYWYSRLFRTHPTDRSFVRSKVYSTRIFLVYFCVASRNWRVFDVSRVGTSRPVTSLIMRFASGCLQSVRVITAKGLRLFVILSRTVEQTTTHLAFCHVCRVDAVGCDVRNGLPFPFSHTSVYIAIHKTPGTLNFRNLCIKPMYSIHVDYVHPQNIF